ncbi:hypothetical protein CHS0354_028828, partial [Potamilus streckersoni]
PSSKNTKRRPTTTTRKQQSGINNNNKKEGRHTNGRTNITQEESTKDINTEENENNTWKQSGYKQDTSLKRIL